MDTIGSTQPRRVKVYSLQGDRWIDKGTGYCSGEIDSMDKIPQFIVRNELNYSELLLKATIQGNTQYQRQQDTLIVWTDLDGDDYALSFQEPEGCLSLCEFLINVQNTIEPNISLVAVTSNGQDGEITEVIAGPIPEPPEPNNDNLFEILELIGQGSKSIKFKETILEFIENKNYLIKLIEIFEKNELNKNLTNLYYLCDIIKALIFYNDSNILEKFLNDNIIIGIVGILEYDPDFLNFKSNHRDYLIDETKFKEVIPLKNNEIRDLIKKTFRLQFLKDVVLARLLDDSTFNCISTMIHINYDRIINFLINSNDFLPELFNLYNNNNNDNTDTDTEIIIDRKRDGIKMIQQFVLVAKKFQPSSRSEFYKSLIDKGLFKMITFAFKDTEIESRILATELIVTIIQHDVLLLSRNLKKNLSSSPIIVNNKQDKDIKKDDNSDNDNDNKQLESLDDNNDIYIDDNLSLISILSDVVIDEDDIGLKIQSFEALKILLDPDNLLYNEGFDREDDFEFRYNNSTNGNGNGSSNNKFNSNNHDYYMIQFYDKIAKKLFNPLINFEESLSKLKLLTKSEIFKYQKLVELISFISNEHSRDYSRSFILENNLLIGISKLINNLKFPLQLRLSAIRCIKFIILLDDEFYTRYIIKFNLLNSTMEFFNKINNINNLSNSTILNLLYLILENENLINFKLLKNYLINNFYNILNSNYQGRKLIDSNNSSTNSYNQINDEIENDDEIDELDELEDEEEEEEEEEDYEEDDGADDENRKVKDNNNDDELYDEEEDDISTSVADIHDGLYDVNKIKNKNNKNNKNKNKNKRKIDEDVSMEFSDTDEENNKRGKNSNNNNNHDDSDKNNDKKDNIDDDDEDDDDHIDELQMTSPDVIPESDEEEGEDKNKNESKINDEEIKKIDSVKSTNSNGEFTKNLNNTMEIEIENQPLESSSSSSSTIIINNNQSDIQQHNKDNNNNIKKISESNILNNNPNKDSKELLIEKEN